jgi:hypothetical protein
MNRIVNRWQMSVADRLVVLLPGFEQMPVEAHYRRFMREAKKTAPVYDFQLEETSPLTISVAEDAVSAGQFSLSSTGKDWSSRTDFILYGLGDITMFYAAQNPLVRLLSGIAALFDFILTGTFFRFVATSWRYGLFFLYPLVLIAAAIAVSYGAGRVAWGLGAGGMIIPVTLSFLSVIAVFWLAARKMHFLLIMDDWAFARDIARGRRPEIMAKMENVISDAAERISSAPPSAEIVVAAHSLGAICALQILDAALYRDGSRCYGLLTVGSSLLKVALHPAARNLRKSVETVVRSDAIWVDVQALTDPMNFYKSDPVRDLKLAGGTSPVLVRVRFRSQLCEEAYNAIRRDFFRVHRQFVFGVEKRTHYSWHAILCGPERFADIAAQGGLPCDRPVSTPAPLNVPDIAAT